MSLTVKLGFSALQLVITAVLVWVVLKRVDLAPVGAFLDSGQALTAVILSLVVLMAQAVLAALRIRLIFRLTGDDLPPGLGFSTWMMGLLVSQVAFIAGDAARVWQLARRGYGKGRAGGAIFLERALGFAVLMAMALLCTPYLLARATDQATRAGLLSLAALCVAGIAGFVASAYISRIMAHVAPRLHAQRLAAGLADVASAVRHMAASWPLTFEIILLSVVMHLCNAAVFYILGTAAGVTLGPLTTILVATPVMLMALLPIALAGWGVREGAAVVGYGLFAVPAQTATTVSIAFGLALLIVSLPGAVFLWSAKSNTSAREGPPA